MKGSHLSVLLPVLATLGVFQCVQLEGQAPKKGARPAGTIAASPNPCQIPAGKVECTTNITWSTQGVTHAKVFVAAETKHGRLDKEFASGRSCEMGRCQASWIEAGAQYVFTLYDYSSGNRGAGLASVEVIAAGGERAEQAAEKGGRPAGTIAANPNPCQIPQGKAVCTTDLTWSTQGVTHAKVFVAYESKHGRVEKEFASGRSCAAGRCPAPWIEKGTQYVFTLYDFSSGSRGAGLASVEVAATGAGRR